ncbi:hypothetical protein QIH80_09770 [Bradyrhizobium elkanii]|nr:hypothetical protein QIH80_09770 [Bradyrhizobium elkanii]
MSGSVSTSLKWSGGATEAEAKLKRLYDGIENGVSDLSLKD